MGTAVAFVKRARENTLRDSVKIDIQNGRAEAAMIRETSPGGIIVVHAVKKSPFVHERLFDLNRIDAQSYDAAERFNHDFEKANLSGRYSVLDMNRSTGGGRHIDSDGVSDARQRVNGALSSLGAASVDRSLSKSCVWFVVGCGDTLEKWAMRRRNGGENMSEGKASGVLISALERLALHYGLTSEKEIRQTQNQKSFIDGVLFAARAAMSFHPKCDPSEALAMFAKSIQKKYGDTNG